MTSFALTDQTAFAFYLRQQHQPVRAKVAPAAVPPTAAALPAPVTLPGAAALQSAAASSPQPPSQYGLGLIATALVLTLHLALPALLTQTPLPVTAVQIPPMTVQLQRVQQPVAVPAKPTPPTVEKKLETPKPVQKKLPPAKPQEPVKTTPTPVPQAVSQPAVQPRIPQQVQSQPQPEPVAAPVFVAATAEPDYLQNPAPAYPETALENGWEGTVLLNVHVTGDGKADDVQIKHSSGRKILDNAAVATVAGWSFVPAKQGEQAVDSWVEVPIEFSLTNS